MTNVMHDLARVSCRCGQIVLFFSLRTNFGEGGLALVCGHPHQIGDVMRVRWVFGPQSLVGEVECEVRHVTERLINALGDLMP